MEYIFYASLVFTFIYAIYFIKRVVRTRIIDGLDIIMLAPVINIVLCSVGIFLVLISKLINTKWEFKQKKNEK